MNKIVFILALILGSLASFSINSKAEPVTVNSCNRQVTFNAVPKSAVSNDVNLTEIMLSLGLINNMVGYTGISGWKTLDAKIIKGVKALPELSKQYPTKEILIGANADFYFAGWNYGLKVGGEVTPETLKPFGIKVYELTESCIHVTKKKPASMDDLYNDIRNLGTIFAINKKAETLISTYKAKISNLVKTINKKAKPIKAFVYDSGEKTPFTAGSYAMPNALIEIAGGINIMRDLKKSWSQVSWETVINKNPDIIVIINYGDVTAKQKIDYLLNKVALKSINAIKNQNFVVLEYVEATPGPRNVKAIEKLINSFWNN